MKKRKLFIDMDGVVADFDAGVKKFKERHEVVWKELGYDKMEEEGTIDDIRGLFLHFPPIDGAIENVNNLFDMFDCYILTTAPWNNPTAASDKITWIKAFLPKFEKRIIITHNKELLNDGSAFLIDDRDGHGASEFGNRHIRIFSPVFPTWDNVMLLLNTVWNYDNQ